MHSPNKGYALVKNKIVRCMMTRTIIILVITYLLNTVDYFQTLYAVQQFGLSIELNSIGRWLLENDCAWIAKLIVVPIALIVLGIFVKPDKKLIIFPYLLLIFYIFIVINNFIVLSQMGVF